MKRLVERVLGSWELCVFAAALVEAVVLMGVHMARGIWASVRNGLRR